MDHLNNYSRGEYKSWWLKEVGTTTEVANTSNANDNRSEQAVTADKPAETTFNQIQNN